MTCHDSPRLLAPIAGVLELWGVKDLQGAANDLAIVFAKTTKVKLRYTDRYCMSPSLTVLPNDYGITNKLS